MSRRTDFVTPLMRSMYDDYHFFLNDARKRRMLGKHSDRDIARTVFELKDYKIGKP
jgi:hypothetical protein